MVPQKLGLPGGSSRDLGELEGNSDQFLEEVLDRDGLGSDRARRVLPAEAHQESFVVGSDAIEVALPIRLVINDIEHPDIRFAGLVHRTHEILSVGAHTGSTLRDALSRELSERL